MKKLLHIVALLVALATSVPACPYYEIHDMFVYGNQGSPWSSAYWPIIYGGDSGYLWAEGTNGIGVGFYCGFQAPDGNYPFFDAAGFSNVQLADWGYAGDFYVFAYNRTVTCHDYECFIVQGEQAYEVRCTASTTSATMYNDTFWC